MPSWAKGLTGRVYFRSLKLTPPISHPIGGMMTSATMLLTILPNAPPMITPTAMSTTLPFMANVLKSFKNELIIIVCFVNCTF